MTPTLLVTSLAAEIRLATSTLRLPIEYHDSADEISSRREVQIFEQYIPRDLFENNTYFPCVVIEGLETHDQLRGEDIRSVATVGLSFGVFAKEQDGWQDCFHLMEVVRQRLLSVRTLADRFRLGDEVTWEIGKNQPAPFFFGYAELEYAIYLPQEPIPLYREKTADLLTPITPKVYRTDAFSRRIS